MSGFTTTKDYSFLSRLKIPLKWILINEDINTF
jgi:hypothetical protein